METETLDRSSIKNYEETHDAIYFIEREIENHIFINQLIAEEIYGS